MITALDLSKIIFDNDAFRTDIGYNDYLIFNRVDEDCQTKYGRFRMNLITITHIENGRRTKISNIIGTSNGRFRITSTEKSIYGKHLTYDLLKMCYLEIDNG